MSFRLSFHFGQMILYYFGFCLKITNLIVNTIHVFFQRRIRTVPYLPEQLQYLLDLLLLEAAMVIGMLLAINFILSKDLSSDMWQCIRGTCIGAETGSCSCLFLIYFLDATTHLYKRSSPSARPSLRTVLFSNVENRGF